MRMQGPHQSLPEKFSRMYLWSVAAVCFALTKSVSQLTELVNTQQASKVISNLIINQKILAIQASEGNRHGMRIHAIHDTFGAKFSWAVFVNGLQTNIQA